MRYGSSREEDRRRIGLRMLHSVTVHGRNIASEFFIYIAAE